MNPHPRDEPRHNRQRRLPSDRNTMTKSAFNPQLRAARFLPRTIITARTLPTLRFLTRLTGSRRRPDAEVVSVNADVSVHVIRPASARPQSPALLWIHGGGTVLGDAAQDSGFSRRVADQLGIVVVSVEYRLAPEHPFPAPLEDTYAALQWLAGQPDIDPARIAVGGESAGGGLAAALALLARERGEVRPVLQLLSYPMLDDRTTTRTDIDPRRLRIWSPAATCSAGAPTSAPPRRTGTCPRWPRPLATTTSPVSRPHGSASARTTCSTTRTSPMPGGWRGPAWPRPFTSCPVRITTSTPSKRRPPSRKPSSRPESRHWTKRSTGPARCFRRALKSMARGAGHD